MSDELADNVRYSKPSKLKGGTWHILLRGQWCVESKANVIALLKHRGYDTRAIQEMLAAAIENYCTAPHLDLTNETKV
jgi:hypothetical protein